MGLSQSRRRDCEKNNDKLMPKPYQPQDRYFKQAKAEGYRARSVFKLQEIQEQFHLIRKGDFVLDLGAAPGSFMQYLVQAVGSEGFVVGLDLQSIDLFDTKKARTFICDIFDDTKLSECLQEYPFFNLITSDLAPNTSGIKSLDAGRSFELSTRVLAISATRLKQGGHLLIKYFPGAEQGELIQRLKESFKKVTSYRPKAIRSSSREQYLIGMHKR